MGRFFGAIFMGSFIAALAALFSVGVFIPPFLNFLIGHIFGTLVVAAVLALLIATNQIYWLVRCIIYLFNRFAKVQS